MLDINKHCQSERDCISDEWSTLIWGHKTHRTLKPRSKLCILILKSVYKIVCLYSWQHVSGYFHRSCCVADLWENVSHKSLVVWGSGYKKSINSSPVVSDFVSLVRVCGWTQWTGTIRDRAETPVCKRERLITRVSSDYHLLGYSCLPWPGDQKAINLLSWTTRHQIASHQF